MAIYGYSERGIINSLVFSIGDDNALMGSFIKSLGIPMRLGTPREYTVLLEHSFFELGVSDLIIIISYDDSAEDKVLFIEGKAKNSGSTNWPIVYYQDRFDKNKEHHGFTSNLFFQLHLKKLLFDRREVIMETGEIIEPRFNKKRKTARNPIVTRAFEHIAKCRPFYVGIVPLTDREIAEFNSTVVYTNYPEDFVKIGKYIHLVSWETVYGFCIAKGLETVNSNFEYNRELFF
ncbi:hypothetical protein [Flavobacterium capsici]|uniref:Uncharacterized protein n=1 Tax=Flavobacterium capsici TaxID=3075618 RepID=A0AA96F1C1_9FLAO|nr:MULTISPECIES: hypothetical protein [unclassified Flavobacterium]WNM17975.1 hypothetical protein RN608_08110 [Flavobacterium sp. PMR2A8]WNM22027.1 hypothetical protein RN605_01410 [Flavobacterium sp. PMTSA4]